MTIRRLNYTGRQRIARDDVSIELICNENEPPHFRADLVLHRYDLPGDANVFVEAYYQTVRMPFCFGTIDCLVTPLDTNLSEFQEAPELAKFRVRVTDLSNTRGLLLAEVSGISANSEKTNNSQSLLEVKPAPLGEVPYRIEFSGENVQLQINESIPNWRAFSDSILFKSMVGPTVLREVLNRILLVEQECDPDGPRWTSQWLKMVSKLPGTLGKPPEITEANDVFEKADSIEEWVDDVVMSFCRQQKSQGKLISFLSEERFQL